MKRLFALFAFYILSLLVASAQQTTIKPWDLNRDSVVATNVMIATTNKATAGSITMYNGSSSTLYLLVFDLSTNAVPAAGRVPTLPAVAVPSNGTGYWDWNATGRKFLNGIVVAHSTTPFSLTNSGVTSWFTVSWNGLPN